MTRISRRVVVALTLGAAATAVSAAADAQAAPKTATKTTCTINESSPFQINSAKVYLNQAMSQRGAPDEKPKHLRNAIGALEKAATVDNQLGRNWVLGRTLIWWTMLPGQTKTVMTRGEAGFTANPAATIDLLAAADTALSYVEQNAPQCADSIALFRQQPWVRLINAANSAANAGQWDSAAAIAQRSLIIYRNSPYAYQVLALAAQRKNDYAAAVQNFEQVIAKTASDTATNARRMRKDAMYNSALLVTNQANDPAQSGQRDALTRKVTELWRSYLKEYPEDANAKAALAQALAASGDTAAVSAAYSDMLANPAKYTDQQLVEAGVGLVNSNRSADAIKLFEAAVAQNPYNRDALFDIATTYYAAGNAALTQTYAKRLVEIDPNNPDNYKLLAGSYQLLAAATKDAKAKKLASDSLLVYLQKAEKMPARVTFSLFNHTGAKHTLGGHVENLGTAAGNYTLKVEFLDKSGKPVATQTAVVGPVAPKESKQFTVSVEQPGVVAFRTASLQ